jgi:hypothetical protein
MLAGYEKPVPMKALAVVDKLDSFVLGLFCCGVAAVSGYIAITSLAHWAMTGEMLYFRAFDPDRISVRQKIGASGSLWAYRIAAPGTHAWYSSLLVYLCMAAAAPVIGWIGLVKGFGVRMAEHFSQLYEQSAWWAPCCLQFCFFCVSVTASLDSLSGWLAV